MIPEKVGGQLLQRYVREIVLYSHPMTSLTKLFSHHSKSVSLVGNQSNKMTPDPLGAL